MKDLNLIFKGAKRGFTGFGDLISTLVNATLLLLVYLLGVGITSVIAKLVRKHFLEMETNPNLESYWVDLNLEEDKVDNFYRQF